MERAKFDPRRMAVASQDGISPAGPSDRNEEPLSVAEVAALVQQAVDGLPQRLRVIGQVSNFSDRTHWFFTIKDTEAALRCVMFASAVRRHSQAGIGDGMLVVATGRVDFYAQQGQLQFYVESVCPVGEGVLERQFRELCDRLRNDGYFDQDRKRSLPLVPRAVAVITSRSGAAWQDVVDTTRKRWAGCPLILVDVRVQGEAAASGIAAALRAMSRDGPGMGVEVIILTRGGGSAEDLWAFNEREVADAVFASRVPVVAAIGHESDTTVAELVADLRSATPTQATMRVVPDATSLLHQVKQLGRRLGSTVTRMMQQMQERLRGMRSRSLYRRPTLLLKPPRQRLDRGGDRMVSVQRHALASAHLALREAQQSLPRIDPMGALRLARQRVAVAESSLQGHARLLLQERGKRLEAAAKQLSAVGPDHVLRRGFSYTEGPNGCLISSVDQVSEATVVTTTVADGRFHSRVITGVGPLPQTRRERSEGHDGPGLFDPAVEGSRR